MTATLAEASASGSGAPTGGGSRRRRVPKRSTLLIAVFLVLAVAVVALTSGGPVRGGDLDPDNPDPDGAQALARVLADQGVDVTVARDAEALAALDPDAGTTVVVTSADDLGQSTADRLLRDAPDSRIVVVDPSSALLRALEVDGFPRAADTSDPIPAGCDAPGFDGLEIEVDAADSLPLEGCFDDTLVTSGRLVLLGAGELLSNDQVTRADNATVALRLLGGSERLVWYVASVDDLVADDSVSATSLLPDYLGPSLFLVLLVSIGLILWRGRRLGPLATEPLPVVVRAIETTHSRGRLYRRSGDRGHAARVLRSATRARAAARLGLPRTVDEQVLIRDVARHVQRPEHEVGALLSSANTGPGSDRDLVRLAHQLAELEKEIRRS